MIAEYSVGVPSIPPHPAPLQAPSGWNRWGRKLLVGLVLGYGMVIVALWAWMIWDGDRGWLGTVILFGPRWIFALPLPLLALAAAVFRRWLLGPLALTALAIVFLLMGFQAHLPVSAATNSPLRVMTCNVNQDHFLKHGLLELIEREKPDIVALQEVFYKTHFLWPPGWYVVNRDEFIVASRFPVVEREPISRIVPSSYIAVRFTVELPDREIQVFNLHQVTPRSGLEALANRHDGITEQGIERLESVLQRRAAEARKASQWIAQFPGPKIVLGDFNMPIESIIYQRSWSSLANAFSTVGNGFGFTKITEKAGWNYGSRIDHILFNSEWRALRCWVGTDVGSDHLPLLAELESSQSPVGQRENGAAWENPRK